MPESLQEDRELQRNAQKVWAAKTIAERLRVLKRARHGLAAASSELVGAFPADLARTRADSYVAEVLPLLAACKFLERESCDLLRPRPLGKEGLPFWLSGVETVVERVPFGVVLIIGPANYPLFLPGVQALQAVAAGNAVVWKPGRGGGAVAQQFLLATSDAGLPEGLIRVSDESVQAGVSELQAGADKVFFTGSAQAGREVMRACAETATPVVTELSGCDVVVVLESADTDRVLAALKFGMRLNGSATCMAPRRLVLVGRGHEGLVARLRDEFASMQGMPISGPACVRLTALLDDARRGGASICGEFAAGRIKPVLVLNARPEMSIAQSDIFAPVLTVLRVASALELPELDEVCPFGLTAAIFGDEAAARGAGAMLHVGTVLLNDLIVPTADPRASFGGRRGSGYGSTRGREGLLEMTAVKTTAVRTSKSLRHYQQTGDAHEAMFAGVVAMSHGAGFRARWNGLRRMVSAAMRLR